MVFESFKAISLVKQECRDEACSKVAAAIDGAGEERRRHTNQMQTKRRVGTLLSCE